MLAQSAESRRSDRPHPGRPRLQDQCGTGTVVIDWRRDTVDWLLSWYGCCLDEQVFSILRHVHVIRYRISETPKWYSPGNRPV